MSRLNLLKYFDESDVVDENCDLATPLWSGSTAPRRYARRCRDAAAPRNGSAGFHFDRHPALAMKLTRIRGAGIATCRRMGGGIWTNANGRPCQANDGPRSRAPVTLGAPRRALRMGPMPRCPFSRRGVYLSAPATVSCRRSRRRRPAVKAIGQRRKMRRLLSATQAKRRGFAEARKCPHTSFSMDAR